MMPVARNPTGELKGGFSEYIKRRATRILTPYYAALALSLLITIAVPALQKPSDVSVWDNSYPSFRVPEILSHVFLLHHFNNDWIFRINSPLWSVSVEWMIYFIFPAVLLPVWRKVGVIAAVGTGIGMGMLAYIAAPMLLSNGCPWMIGCFALGMGAAVVNFSPKPEMQRIRDALPWGIFAYAGFVGVFAWSVLAERSFWDVVWRSDLAIAAVSACLLVYLTKKKNEKKEGIDIKIFESKISRVLGNFSYSVYLIHMPLICALQEIIIHLHLSPMQRLAALWGFVIPTATLLCYGFHRIFEVPFMSGHPLASEAGKKRAYYFLVPLFGVILWALWIAVVNPQPTRREMLAAEDLPLKIDAQERPAFLQDVYSVVVLGDSITQEGEKKGGYVQYLQTATARAIDDYYGVRIFSRGHGGDQARDIVERLQRDALSKKPDLVIVNVGVNDVYHGFDPDHPAGDGPAGVAPEEYRRMVQQIVDDITEKGSNTRKIALVSPTMVGEDIDGFANQKATALRKVMREIVDETAARSKNGQKNIIYIDAHAAMVEEILQCKKEQGEQFKLTIDERTRLWGGCVTRDGLHLNDKGNRTMALAILRGLGLRADLRD